MCQSQGHTVRPAVPAARTGHTGGAGLVFGPAGDHPDTPLRQRNGLQQGTRASLNQRVQPIYQPACISAQLRLRIEITVSLIDYHTFFSCDFNIFC